MIQHLLFALLSSSPATQQGDGQELVQAEGYAGPALYAALFDPDSSWSFEVQRRVNHGDVYDSFVYRTVTCRPSWVTTTAAGSVSIISCDHSLDNPIAGT